MRANQLTFLAVAACTLLALAAGSAPGGMIYWTDSGTQKIQRAPADGGPVEDIVMDSLPGGIAFDLLQGKMYWTSVIGGTIKRTNLDGTGSETIVSGLIRPRGIALGQDPSKIYWTEAHVSTRRIQRANLDGTGVEQLVTENGYPYAIAVGSMRMYWANCGDLPASHIKRADLDGSHDMDYVAVGDFWAVALDEEAGYLYWASRFYIMRGPMDAHNDPGNAETLYDTHGGQLKGLALDLDGGKMYWTEKGAFTGIKRANLDGTDVEVIVSGLIQPGGIAFLVPEPATLGLLALGGLPLVRRRRPSSGRRPCQHRLANG